VIVEMVAQIRAKRVMFFLLRLKNVKNAYKIANHAIPTVLLLGVKNVS
jgi:hypothetical protein